jgi:hypothetical protein
MRDEQLPYPPQIRYLRCSYRCPKRHQNRYMNDIAINPHAGECVGMHHGQRGFGRPIGDMAVLGLIAGWATPALLSKSML